MNLLLWYRQSEPGVARIREINYAFGLYIGNGFATLIFNLKTCQEQVTSSAH